MSEDSTKSVKPAHPAAQDKGRTFPWSPFTAIVLVAVTYLVSQTIAGALVLVYPLARGWSEAQVTAWFETSIWPQFGFVLVSWAMVLGALYAFMKYSKVRFAALGFRRPWFSDFGLAGLVAPLYMAAFLAVALLAEVLIPAIDTEQQQQLGFAPGADPVALLLAFVSLVIIPPLAEETVFRGFLYGSLKKSFSVIKAALIASLIFGAVHLQLGSGAPPLWIAAIDTFVLSLFLCYLREKTGALWAPIALHFLKNLLAYYYIFIHPLG